MRTTSAPGLQCPPNAAAINGIYGRSAVLTSTSPTMADRHLPQRHIAPAVPPRHSSTHLPQIEATK
jgi:hypothetical protein